MTMARAHEEFYSLKGERIDCDAAIEMLGTLIAVKSAGEDGGEPLYSVRLYDIDDPKISFCLADSASSEQIRRMAQMIGACHHLARQA